MHYAHDPLRAPDTDFVPATYARLAAGAKGRLLDPRRTPIVVIDVAPEAGWFDVEVRGFEDTGARWRVPLEGISRFQLAPGGPEASEGEVRACEACVERLAEPYVIEAYPSVRARSEVALAEAESDARAWLAEHGGDEIALDARAMDGLPFLFELVERYMEAFGVRELDERFGRAWVSNPWPLGVVLGHRIALAKLGLSAFRGTIVREPELFDEDTLALRETHIVRRMGFVRALMRREFGACVPLYRGLSFDGPPEPPLTHGLRSATFSRSLAQEHFDAVSGGNGALLRQQVPVERLLLTYFETRAMNAPFREAEALLIVNDATGLF